MRTLALLTLSLVLLPSLLIAKGKPKRQTVTAPDAASVAALATANHFLRAWQTGDLETGLLFSLTPRAMVRMKTTCAVIFQPRCFAPSKFTAANNCAPAAAFPVVLLETTNPSRAKRRYSEIIVINTGSNDWAVDKLP